MTSSAGRSAFSPRWANRGGSPGCSAACGNCSHNALEALAPRPAAYRLEFRASRRTIMFTLDAFHLARAQFAFTVIFHIVFPALSIGLASYLAVLEGLWLATGRRVFLDLFQYWLKIFSVGFAMGVVSGLVMSYQFGTNWAAFSDKAGPVIGPLMGYEVLTAFFLEAGFLGVMLFGMRRIGRALHYLATLMVPLVTLLSAT